MAVETRDPYLNVDNETSTRGFLEFANRIQTDAVLSDVVRTWIVPGRSNQDLIDQLGDNPALITLEQCPCVELWPQPRDGQLWANVLQKSTLEIRIRIFLAGNRPLSAINLWGLVQKAVYPQDASISQQLRAALGAIGFNGEPALLSQPTITIEQKGERLRTRADGAISASYRIRGY